MINGYKNESATTVRQFLEVRGWRFEVGGVSSRTMYAHNYPIKLKLRCVLRHVKSLLADGRTDRETDIETDIERQT